MQLPFFGKSKAGNSSASSSIITLKECCQVETEEDLFHESISGFLQEQMGTIAIQEGNNSKKPQKKRKRVVFTDEIQIVETYSAKEYDRKGDFMMRPLAPHVINAIKRELNEFKGEMQIHPESRKYTQFYRFC